jgi:hypothetical protein
MRRAARVAAVPLHLAADAFSEASAAVTARLDRFFPEGYDDAPTADALDAANPYWDFSLNTDSGSDFGYDASGPSLDL